MKVSSFTLFVPYKDKYLVYNTLSRAFVTMGDELFSALDNPENLPEETKEQMIRLGVLVDDDVDESERAKDWYDKLRLNKSMMRTVILTTYNCNFACEYCVEDGVKSNIDMDEQCSHHVVEWLTNRAEREGVKHIRTVFYGGEPLLEVAPIEYISQKLHGYAKEHELSFSFTITTNGSLLTEDIVDRLLPYGLSSVKVTLDGDREAHNSKRPFKSGKGSFDLIVENVSKVADRTAVMLGGNVDKENMDSIQSLLSYLEEKGLKERLADVEFYPIVKTLGQTSTALNDGIQTNCISLSESKVLDDLLSLKREVAERGFKTNTFLPVSICGMNQDGGLLVIDPLGKIYTCPAFVGRDGFCVGDINSDQLNQRHSFFVNQELKTECLKCVYLPLCGGGCRYAAYVKYGDCSRRICDRDYYQKLSEELLKLRYEEYKGG